MRWIQFKIKTITQAEDMIISALYDIGFEGAQIEDKIPLSEEEKEQMFVDILPAAEEDDGIAYLSFFVEDHENFTPEERQLFIEETRHKVEQELKEISSYMEIGDGTITVAQTEDIDWINNWKQYFHQFYIDDILVIPSWEDKKAEDQDRIVLHIDPGTAFGTGMHETTQLCIRQLRKYITSKTELLDVGTGSGILSILSVMFGAKHAVGTDLDPCAVEAVLDNKKANGVPDSRFELWIGNLITDEKIREKVGYGCYDIVTANILAEVLIPLTPIVKEHLKPGGIYITSGIIDEKEEIVAKAVRDSGLEILEITRQGEWVSITARKNG